MIFCATLFRSAAALLLVSFLCFPGASNAAEPKAPGTRPTPKPRRPDDASTPAPVNANRRLAFKERAKNGDIRLVFLGDTITELWERKGKDSWDEFFVRFNPANFGVAGEHTEHTLGHIAGGILSGLRPDVVVILIGTENIGHIAEERSWWTAAGIKKILTEVHERLPETRVLLLGLLPRERPDSRRRKLVNEINAVISKLDDGKKTRFLDLGPQLTDADGAIVKELIPDGVLPSQKGYRMMAETMLPLLKEMIK